MRRWCCLLTCSRWCWSSIRPTFRRRPGRQSAGGLRRQRREHKRLRAALQVRPGQSVVLVTEYRASDDLGRLHSAECFAQQAPAGADPVQRGGEPVSADGPAGGAARADASRRCRPGALRVVVRHKVSLANMLPSKQRLKIERLPGVAACTKLLWFGGIYRDERNFFLSSPATPRPCSR